MPSMNEIYKKYSYQYDQLVNAEDYNNNLSSFLLDAFTWDNKIVYEAGIGTGRVSKIYIDRIKLLFGFDREEHMLVQCAKNLHNYCDKIILNIGDNIYLRPGKEKADIFIEGWSFGHTIAESKIQVATTVNKIMKKINNIIKENGITIIIESLGTNTMKSRIDNQYLMTFYRLLEKEYNFKKQILRTDYKFEDYKRSAEVMGFFFGQEMKDKIITSKQSIVPEFTGVWYKAGI